MKKALLVLLPFCFLLLSNNIFGQIQKITFGVNHFYPPFVYTTSKGVYGFDISISEALCEKLHAQCIFKTMTVEKMFISLDANNVDAIISALSITPEREKKYNSTNPYFKSTMSYLGLSTSNITITPDSLRGKKIGVGMGTSFESYVTKTYGKRVIIKSYASKEDAIDNLARGKIDLFLLDTPVAKYWVEHSAGKFKLIGETSILPNDNGYAIFVRNGNASLVEELNKALASIVADGTYEKIKSTYFRF